MLNYIRAEFYKVFRRKYTWITLGIALALEALLASGFAFTNAHGNNMTFYRGAIMVTVMLSVGFYATLLTGDMVFAGQYKNSTLKNEVSFGLSRTRIYLGKLAVQMVMSILFCVVMVAFYVGLCWLLLYHDPETDALIMQIIGSCLATVFPLWVGVQAVTCACMFLIKSELGGAFLAVGIFALLPNVVWLASALISGSDGNLVGDALMAVYNHMPTVMAENAVNVVGDWAFCGKAWIVGAVWFAVFTAIGLCGFRKKEIK
ncbi:MAG: ABC transporter permease [Oscillospiraceae bacterium]